jgi:hypothetical protein
MCRHTPTYAVYKKLKTETNIFEMGAESFLPSMKEKWGEGGGGVLLGDNTSGAEGTPWPIRFQCYLVCIST